MRMESIEYYAQVSMYTRGLIGQANELTCEQVDRLIERRTNSGITTGGRPLCRNCGPDGERACEAGKSCSCHPAEGGSCTCSCVRPAESGKADEAALVAEIVSSILAAKGYR